MKRRNADESAHSCHRAVPSLSDDQIGLVANGDFEKIASEYRALVASAQARIMEVMGIDYWPIGQSIAITYEQEKQLDDPCDQWDAAEYELNRVSIALSGEPIPELSLHLTDLS